MSFALGFCCSTALRCSALHALTDHLSPQLNAVCPKIALCLHATLLKTLLRFNIEQMLLYSLKPQQTYTSLSFAADS